MTEQAQEDGAQKPADAARQYANMIWQYRQAETVAAMIYVGDKLGLFKAMADAGPLSADQLAAKTGLHPRWLLEWMRLQAAARVLAYRGDDRFELPAEASDLLANSEASGFAASSFMGGHPPAQLAGLMESFRTGIGKTYKSDGPATVTKSRRAPSHHGRKGRRTENDTSARERRGQARKRRPGRGCRLRRRRAGDRPGQGGIRARFFTRWTRAGLRSSTSSGGPPRTN